MYMNFEGKEQAVYESVLQLLREGADWHTLKVADIAAAANMGKGTVYEYFGSKEEILEKAAVYGAVKWVTSISARVGKEKGFSGKVAHFALGVQEGLRDKRLLSQAFYAEGEMGCQKPAVREIRSYVAALIEDILQAGRREGLVHTDEAFAKEVLFYLAAGYATKLFITDGKDDSNGETLARAARAVLA